MSEPNQFTDLLPGAPLEPEQIAELARLAAARVDVDRLVRRDRDSRFCLRLWRDEHSEAWLLGWLDDQETGFHDHDSSAGGVHVIEGSVREDRLTLGGPHVTRVLSAGDSFSFDTQHIHRMSHHGDVPALSLHVYSPPLESMGSYEIADGVLRRLSIPPDAELAPRGDLVIAA
jgi:quercetin dioxygenase-like cupin family protein